MVQDVTVYDLMADIDTVRHYVRNLHWGDALNLLERCISIYSSSLEPDTDVLQRMENTADLIKRAFDDVQLRDYVVDNLDTLLLYLERLADPRINQSVSSSREVSMSRFGSRAGRPALRIQSAMVQEHLDELGSEFASAVLVLRDHVVEGRWSSVWIDCDTLYSIAKEVEDALAGADQAAMDNVFKKLISVNEAVYECSALDSDIYGSEQMDSLDDSLNRVLGAMDFVVRHS